MIPDATQHTVMLVVPAVAEARGRMVPLFLEATQRKAVRTVVAAMRNNSQVIEIQAVGIGVRNRRSPTVSGGADAI